MPNRKLELFFMLILILSLCLPFTSTYAVPNPSEMIVAAAEGSRPGGLDPSVYHNDAGWELQLNVYQTLIFFDREKTDQFVPMLATSWDVSADGLTYTFQIKGTNGTEPPVKFHNGDDLTTEDVEYSFERLMVQDTGFASFFYEPLLNRLSSRDEAGNIVVTAEQIDNAITRTATTITFHLVIPYPPFLQILSMVYASILNKDWCVALGDWPGTWENWQNYSNPSESIIDLQDTQAPGPHVNAMCGTGPYYFEYLDDTLEEWSIRKFDDYWGGWPAPGARGFVDRVKVTWHYTWEDRRDLFLAGQIDSLNVPRANAAEVLDQSGVRCIYPLPILGCNALFFNFNINETSPNLGVPGGLPRGTFNESGIPPDFFSDADTRKGFAYCINYTKIIDEVWLGEACQPATPIVWGLPFHNAEQEKYSVNLTEAEEHFRTAWDGQLWTNGFRMTLAYNIGSPVLPSVYDMIKAGVESLNAKFHVDVVPIYWSEFSPQRTQGQLPIFYWGWLADFADPHNFAYAFMHSHGSFPPIQRYANATVDALIEAGIRELNPNRRKQIYYDLQGLYHEDCPSVPLFQGRGRRVERDWVQGWYYNPLVSVNYFYAQWKEESPPTKVNAGSNTVDKLEASDTIVLINVTVTGNISVSKHDINLEGIIPVDVAKVKCVLFDTTLDSSEIVFPIEICIYFTDQDVKSANVVRSTLRIYYWNGTDWDLENDTGVVAPSDVSGYAGYVRARITHLSMFALIGKRAPDVAIMNVSSFKTVVGLGYSLNINITAAHALDEGDYPETFNVTAYCGNGTFTPEQWNSFWSMGDCNRDGYINMVDADILENNFGWSGPPGSNPADLNSDGTVDMLDAITLAGGFGKQIWKVFLSVIGAQTISNFAEGDFATLMFAWNTTGVVYGNYTMTAVADPVANETNTADNNCTCNIAVHVGVPGDISGPTLGVYDGKCDMRDISYLIIRFNSKPGSANWNPNADINNDATVNMRDISIAILNFNKHE